MAISSELTIRSLCFVAGFLCLILIEVLKPSHQLILARAQRWPGNLGLAILNRALLLPLSGLTVALYAEELNWGLLNQFSLPLWLDIVTTLALMDLGIYAQHRLLHRVDWLWRIHRTHHADPDLDVTTGLRFHPAEALISMCFKMGLVLAVGAPALAIIVFDILLNMTSMFNHSNIKIAPRLDRLLRTVIVTPSVHRVHHSTKNSQMSRNFGFNLVWWDRLFRSFTVPQKDVHAVGIDGFATPREHQFISLLRHPWHKPPLPTNPADPVKSK